MDRKQDGEFQLLVSFPEMKDSYHVKQVLSSEDYYPDPSIMTSAFCPMLEIRHYPHGQVWQVHMILWVVLDNQ